MKRDILIAAATLLIGAASAVIANSLRDGKQRLSFIRTAAPPKEKSASSAASRPAPPVLQAPESAADAGPAADGNPYVTIDEVIRLIQENRTVFLDAREAEEFDKGHIRYAINVPESAVYANIEQVLNNVPETDLVVVYCGGGDCEASHVVTDVLTREYGYQNVKIYQKGWEEIESSGRFAGLLESEGSESGVSEADGSAEQGGKE